MPNHSSILFILWRYKQRIQLTPDEERMLHEWLKQGESNQQLFDELSNDAEWEQRIRDLKLRDTSRIWDYMESRLQSQPLVTAKVIRWWKWAAAAIVLLIMGVSFFWYKGLTYKSPAGVVFKRNGSFQNQSTIDSGVVLTLEDGRRLKLDSNGREVLGALGDSMIGQAGSEKLSYNRKTLGNNTGVSTMHTLSVPAGSQFQVVLADGSIVWLNARSKLKYPSLFNDSVRRVELEGEGYFEVVKNSKTPFAVFTEKAEIHVLGTSFNLHAYNDEDSIKATLINGSVLITNPDAKVVLKPGEEGSTSGNGLIKKGAANLRQATAWKEKLFWFKDAPYEDIMLQISRWYNIEIIYQGKIKGKFRGILPRTMPIAQLLSVLEKGGNAKFLLKGRTLTVIPE